MAKPSRIISALLFPFTLGFGLAPVAQAKPVQASTVANAPTERTADQVAPGREELEPAEPGFDDNTVDNQAGKNWHPTVNPKSTVTPGQMRSDKEEIPGGFTKEQANRAEVQEAKEQAAQARSGIQTFAAVDTCRTYWPSPFKVCGKIREKYDSRRSAKFPNLATIHGAIYDKWVSIGAEKGVLGYPVTDEIATTDGVGRFNRFTGGMMYWHPQHGAHPIAGAFNLIWELANYERGT